MLQQAFFTVATNYTYLVAVTSVLFGVLFYLQKRRDPINKINNQFILRNVLCICLFCVALIYYSKPGNVFTEEFKIAPPTF